VQLWFTLLFFRFSFFAGFGRLAARACSTVSIVEWARVLL
jgi:hypothetical protein